MRTIATMGLVIWAGCGGEPPGDPVTCDGGGPSTVEAGAGGQDAFVPWADGDQVPITQQGSYGFRVELHTGGLDTTGSIVSFVRYSIGAETATEDAGGTLTFQCNADGTGWSEVFTPLDDSLQTADAASGLSGQALHLTVTATDQGADEADQSLDLVFE